MTFPFLTFMIDLTINERGGTPFIVLQEYLRIILKIQLFYKSIRRTIDVDMDNKIIIKII